MRIERMNKADGTPYFVAHITWGLDEGYFEFWVRGASPEACTAEAQRVSDLWSETQWLQALEACGHLDAEMVAFSIDYLGVDCDIRPRGSYGYSVRGGVASRILRRKSNA